MSAAVFLTVGVAGFVLSVTYGGGGGGYILLAMPCAVLAHAWRDSDADRIGVRRCAAFANAALALHFFSASALEPGGALLSSWALLGWFPFLAVSLFAWSAPSAKGACAPRTDRPQCALPP